MTPSPISAQYLLQLIAPSCDGLQIPITTRSSAPNLLVPTRISIQMSHLLVINRTHTAPSSASRGTPSKDKIKHFAQIVVVVPPVQSLTTISRVTLGRACSSAESHTAIMAVYYCFISHVLSLNNVRNLIALHHTFWPR